MMKNLKRLPRRSYSAKVKPIEQTDMERKGNIITITRAVVI
jgi:hypothetical protein